MISKLVLTMLLTTALAAQKVNPLSLSFAAIPGYSSSPQGLAFTNQSTAELALAVAISGPFSISKNQCGHGVKPGTHCNVYVVYAPQGLEYDTGALDFTFDGQTVSIPLTGEGVSIVPTKFTHVSYSKGAVTAIIYAEGNLLPDGEMVVVTCTDYEGANSSWDVGTIKNNKAIVPFPQPIDDWYCSAIYSGDPEFSSAIYGDFWINECRPVDSCHDN